MSKELESQIERWIGLLESYSRKLPHPRSKKNYPYLRDFFKRFVRDQNERTAEISSLAYEKTRKLAKQQLPMKTLWNFCIDGRVTSIFAHGATAGVGNSVRVPGGILREFVRGKDGRLKLDSRSDFAMLLGRAFANKDMVTEVFDSHIGCLARQREEELKGKFHKDAGLLADVSHKMQMAQATQNFVKETFGDEKKLIVALTSFNPYTGFLYMGLETKDVLLYAYKRGNVYTDEILNTLADIGKIISTERLAKDPLLGNIFKHHAFNLDWKDNYVKSAKHFWEGIASMKKKALLLIEGKLVMIYPHLSAKSEEIQLEKEERSMLLLTNAFSGYLHNAGKKKQTSASHDTDSHSTFYPYGIHREEGVKVGEGGYPPYAISLFTVFSFEEKNLPSHIEFASTLVRKNRMEGRVIDRERFFADREAFEQASLPIVVSEIVRDTLLEKEWDALVKIDWFNIPKDWDTLSDDAFFAYLHTKESMRFGVALAINNLRKKMAILYDPYNNISSRLIEQYLVAMPYISSKNRKVRIIIPFVKLGFS